MTRYKNVDLHCHSTCSDGTLAPDVVANRAADQGVDLWSLTDHDDVSGQALAKAAALSRGMAYLCGVEISVTFHDCPLHIVGLGIDPEHETIVEGLQVNRSGRDARAREMSKSLESAGIAGAYEGALKFVSNPSLISRTHFARFLVEKGYCKDVSEVFSRYLTRGKPGYVAIKWASLEDAIAWITASGGMAVVAHPARYPFTRNQEHAFLGAFKAMGGIGIEVNTGSHTASESARYAAIVKEFGLYASRGSDFHTPGDLRTELGAQALLSENLPKIWDALEKRIFTP